MKLAKLIPFLLLVLFTSSFSQGSSTGKVKAVVSDLPSSMNAGETYKVQCTITNTGKTVWSSENLHGKAYGPFEISKEWSGEWTLQPGESTTTYYKITAPDNSGSFRLRVVVYNGNKKIGARTKKIEVVDITTR